jgi:endonuclease/exonuclease/phosphatase family metal-dependent hydrolase
MQEIVTGNFAPVRRIVWAPKSLRVVDWNIDRGQQLRGVTDFLISAKPDILILQEVAQGSKSSPAYHGQATLSKWPISNSRLIRFARQSHFWQPHWFLPKIEPFQERLGGRIALVAEINVPGWKLVTYNLHLESRGDDALRVSQLVEVLSDAASYNTDCPILIAGDLNLDASKQAAALEFAKAGFRDAVSSPGTPTAPARGLFKTAHRIDWAFIRGPIRPTSGRVQSGVKASDHYPISFSLTT